MGSSFPSLEFSLAAVPVARCEEHRRESWALGERTRSHQSRKTSSLLVFRNLKRAGIVLDLFARDVLYEVRCVCSACTSWWVLTTRLWGK